MQEQEQIESYHVTADELYREFCVYLDELNFKKASNCTNDEFFYVTERIIGQMQNVLDQYEAGMYTPSLA